MHENERDKWVIKLLSDNDADVEIVEDLIFEEITRLKSQDLPVSINDALARCFPENHA